MTRRLVPGSLTMLALLVGSLVALGAPAADAAKGGGLEYMGDLPLDDMNGGTLTLVDPDRRRLYNRHGPRGFREYDLTKPISKMKARDIDLPSYSGFMSPNLVSLDRIRNRLFYLDYDTPGTSGCPNCSFIRVLDLETMKPGPQLWNLSQLVPNFYAEGITYAPKEDRVYVVGTLIGFAGFFTSSVIPAPVVPVTVLALDATSGELIWNSTLKKCLHNMVVFGKGSGFYRSARFPALYIGCMRTDTTPALGISFPGQSGIDRVWIDPTGGAEQGLDLREEFFAISGAFTGGDGAQAQLAYDAGSERILVLSRSITTPGVWVLDGLESFWVGFVAAKDAANNSLGIDPSTGHLYMRSGGNGFITVADVRQTPVPQGTEFEYVTGGYVGLLMIDPVTHTVFYPAWDQVRGSRVMVLRDRTKYNDASPPTDYDQLTSDVEESDKTFATFSGTTRGSGASLTFVGGTGAATAPATQHVVVHRTVPTVPGAAPGDRGISVASVPSLDLRNVGASATAQEVVPDTLTDNDRRTDQKAVENAGSAIGQQGTTAQLAGILDWPWPAATCLDADGVEVSDGGAQPGGAASVECDLKTGTVSASARAAAIDADGTEIANTSFSSEAAKGDDGLVTTTKSIARGVALDVPGAGSVRIGKIELDVRTVAEGRPGTAAVTWTRTITDATIADASGKEQFACVNACDPAQLAREINDQFGLKLQMRVPQPQITATPGGAFAGFEQSNKDYFNDLTVNNDTSRAMPAVEFELYNDWSDKSRLFVQLASIQANSIYGITPLPANGPEDPVLPPVSTPDLDVPAPDLTGSTGGQPPRSTLAPGGLVDRIVRSALFMVRKPEDALMIGLVFLLFGGAGGIAVRRRELAALTAMGEVATP